MVTKNSLEETNLKVLHPQGGYALIPNSFAQDHSLSIVTRACLLDTFSRPSNWETTVGGLMAINNIGRDNARRVLREAEAAGYAFSYQKRDDKNRFTKNQWFLSPDKDLILAKKQELGVQPETELPAPETPGPEIPYPGKQQQQNKDNIIRMEQNKDKDLRHSPLAPAASMNFSVQGETGSDYPEDFEEWWSLYPRKVGKGEAAKLWSKLKAVQKQRAMTGLRAQLQDLIRMTRDKRGNFCPHAQTWLRQGRYDDTSSEVVVEKKPNPYLQRDPTFPEHIWVKRVQNFISRNLVSVDEARAYGVPL